MKKINIILTILLSCLSTYFHADETDFDLRNNSTSSHNLLVEKFTLYIKKHAWFIALVPVSIYYHQSIANLITNDPYICSLLFYFGLNYVCDAILHYQHQQLLYNIITLLKKMALYLVVSHGIKNHMQQKKLSFEFDTNDQDFFNHITKDLPYSFHEIMLITLKSYQKLKASMQTFNKQLTIESEEFIFLCHASSITIHNLLYLAQSDVQLYTQIDQFEKDPQLHLQTFLNYLTSHITESFIELEQELLINIPLRTTP